MIGFSTWRPLDELEAAPDGAGVFQVKIEGHLIAYPRGKSAMIYYGSGGRAGLVAVAGELRTRFASLGRLMWRAVETDRDREELARHLRRFSEQFGSQPAGHLPG